MISIIVPCFNEEETLDIFYRETKKVIDIDLKMDYEMILIDDGSKDGTLSVMKSLSKEDPCVKYISFSRNFGKEAAMYAGLVHAKGEYVTIMDADLQDPPSLLPQMVELLEKEDYDSVATRRATRDGESVVRSFFAKQFYKIMNRISDAEIKDGARDFRLMKRKMVDAVVSMTEYNRFSKGIFGWIGFKTYWLSYDNVERVAGNTKWGFWKLFRYAIDGLVNFSQAPLYMASWFGIGMTGVSFLAMLGIIVRKLIFGDPVAGWPSLVCIIIFIGGIQLFCMGVMGQYIAKIYMETKDRPHYIIAETNCE